MSDDQKPTTSTYAVLEELYRELGVSPNDFAGKVLIEGQDPLTPSPHRIGDAAAATLAAVGTEASLLWQERGGAEQDLTVSVSDAIDQLMAVFFSNVNGVPSHTLFEDRKVLENNTFYRAKDGRYIFIVFSYPSLRDIASEVLGCPANDRKRLNDAVAQWDAFELEEAISSRGGTATAVRTREEWRDHPQGRHLLETPLITIEKIGESDPEPFPGLDVEAENALPLSGLRVLDNSHVIAAPIASRTLAEFGADVLHVSSPRFIEPNARIIESGIGKRAAFCDLDDPAQARQFWTVLSEADVYVCNYLNLDAKGFSPGALAKNRPGIVVLDYRCFGTKGPWSMRGGFDYQAVAASGFAVAEGSFDNPKEPTTEVLNDYLAAFLGVAGAMEALRRRARDGGSYRVHVDLTKVCMWVQDLGLISQKEVAGAPEVDRTRPRELTTVDGPFGKTKYLPTQIRFSTLKPRLSSGAEPLGASPLEWW